MLKKLTARELAKNLDERFSSCCDFALRKIRSACGEDIYIASFIVYCDKTYISEAFLKPLITAKDKYNLMSRVAASKLMASNGIDDAISALLGGCAVIFFETENELFIYKTDARSAINRSIAEPDGETVVRGPREGFVENAEVNVALLRKRIKTEKLCVEKFSCGDISKTDIFLVYIKGIADESSVERIKNRLSEIKLPSVVDSGYIEHSLGDSRYPLFPDVGNSEKPDKVAAKIFGGRIAVICDGSPIVLTLPYFFIEGLQSAEDYLKSPYHATFLRIIRMIGTFIAVFLPAIYIALMEFDKAALPHTLYMTVKEARNDIPFTLFTEIVVILIVFEIIREVGVRMPRAVGDAVSIVAGIILGDAAIKAGIASAPVIMVAAISATCSFIAVPMMNSLPLLRLLCLVCARIFGLFGVSLFLIAILSALAVKTSCGKPYLSPVAPLKVRGLYDTLLVIPDIALAGAEKETEV
jgi:spore germination protein KA